MSLERKVHKLKHAAGVRLGVVPPQVDLASFAAPDDLVTKLRADPPSDIFTAFFAPAERPVHKWLHYLPIYERYFRAYRGMPLNFLEIGVLDGGSLDFWRRYFGEQATIVGIDINEKCAERVSPPNHVRIGSQDDPVFLAKLAVEFGPFDIILDDGSHIGRHQSASLDALFPHVKDGGLYAIEDTHTSYWPDHEGDFRRRTSAIEVGKSIVDDMHSWFHHHHQNRPWPKNEVGAVHFYESMIVFEKRKRQPTGMARGGC